MAKTDKQDLETEVLKPLKAISKDVKLLKTRSTALEMRIRDLETFVHAQFPPPVIAEPAEPDHSHTDTPIADETQ